MLETLLTGGQQARGELRFLGEREALNGFTPGQVMTQLGVTTGTRINVNEPWLVFRDITLRKEIWLSRKCNLYSVIFNNIQAHILGGGSVDLGGELFEPKCLGGMGSAWDGTAPGNGSDTVATHGSEWNRFMYGLTARGRTLAGFDPNCDWHAPYTESQLGMAGTANTDYTRTIASSTMVVLRGGGSSDIGAVWARSRTTASGSWAWRVTLWKDY